jgi:dTDP-4-dehydrorhamnose 3,5-epimerase
MSFTFELQALPGVVVITPQVYKDDRGVFMEVYKQTEFLAVGIDDVFVQDNTSVSHYGVLRGLHYQKPPYAQAKLVRCTHGAIWDVAVDIRPDSSTYGHWFGIELNDQTMQMLFIPAGFAHGFLVLSPTATVHYKTSGVYHAPSDAGILWNDPDIGISWPATTTRLLSHKDETLPTLKQVGQPLLSAETRR